MPVFLEEMAADRWLEEYEGPQLDQILEELLQPSPEDTLEAQTVRKLRGKEYGGNTPEITQLAEYPELLFDPDLEGIL